MADDLRYPSEMIDLLEDDELRTRLITEEEVQLLSPKHHYASYYVNHSGLPKYFVAPSNATENDASLKAAWKTVSYPLVTIREAYFNLREEEPQILKVLKDQPWTLIYSTAGFRSMKEYNDRVREILDSFYQNTCVQDAGFSKPSLPQKFRFTKGHSIGESKGNRDILLFLKEILSILLGNDQSEVNEGHKRLESAELMDVVETRVNQLYAELKQEHDLLIHLIRTIHGKYSLNKEVYAVGWDAYKQRNKLYEDLRGHAWNAVTYFHHCVEADEMIMDFLPVFFEFSTALGAGELPTYWEGFSPAPAPAPARSPSISLATGYSQPSISPSTSYSSGMLQSQWQLASLQSPSNSPATSYSPGMLQTPQLQALLASRFARRVQ